MYGVNLLPAAARELARLDKSVAARILRRIHWLVENLDRIRPEPLSAVLAGMFKFRVGDYRVIYEILRNESLLIIHSIGHRKDVYR